MTHKNAGMIVKMTFWGAATITTVFATSPLGKNLIDVYLQRRAAQPYIQETLQTISPDISSKVPAQFKTDVEYALTRLVGTKEAIMLQTADWCVPCRELKKRIHERSLEGTLDSILVTNTEDERKYAQRRFAEEGIHLPHAIPTITRKYDGRIVTYTGCERLCAAMFTPEGLSTSIEIILKK
jgi:hypothetical protein